MSKSASPPGVRGELNHVEVWVTNLERAIATWAWLLESLGYSPFQKWAVGRSWLLRGTYIVIEQSTAISAKHHDRCRPGVNHLAFHAGRYQDVDDLVGRAGAHGWSLLFADRHPHAGGPEHYAAYLEDQDGFEVELVGVPDQG
ncbi:MAG: VOC family protein [Candidatus Dormibacteria bacterium]